MHQPNYIGILVQLECLTILKEKIDKVTKVRAISENVGSS